MLVTALAIALLLAAAWGLGRGLIRLIGGPGLRVGALTIFWTGLTGLSQIFLTIALCTPLTPAVGLTVLILCLAAGMWGGRTTTVPRFLPFSAPVLALGAAALVLVAATLTLPVTWPDTASYHAQIVAWLSGYGLVQGLALLNPKMGFMSGWFTLPAVFNHGPLYGRVMALPGGTVLLLLLGMLAAGLAHVLAPDRTPDAPSGRSALFGLGAGAVIVLAALDKSTSIFVSSSPDLAVAMSAILSLRLLLGGEERSPDFRRDLLALYLACGAAAFKLSGLILPLGLGLTLAVLRPWTLSRLTGAAGLGLAAILPMLAAGLRATGYPLYPSTLLNPHLPWGVPVETALRETRMVTLFARGTLYSDARGLTAFLNWLGHNRTLTGLLVLLAAGLILSAGRLRRSGSQALTCALLCALAGLAYVLWMAPALRFGLGYLAVLAGTLAALWPDLLGRGWGRVTRWRAETLRAACFLILAGLICGLTWQQYFTSRLAREIGASVRQGVLHTDTAFPAPVRPPVLIALGERDGLFHDSVIASRVLNGWPISVAEFGDCAFCQPPCVLVPETDFAVPADPVRGLAAGFLRRPEAE